MDVTTIIGNMANLTPGSDTLESQLGKRIKSDISSKDPISFGESECSPGLGMVNGQWEAKSDNPI